MGIRKDGLCEYTMASDPAGREIVLLSICTISLSTRLCRVFPI